MMLEDTYHSTLDRRWAVRLIAPEKAMVAVIVDGSESPDKRGKRIRNSRIEKAGMPELYLMM